MFTEPNPTDRRDAALGAILGACVGDAAGAKLEFESGDLTASRVDNAMTLPGGGCWRVAPGQITDDGELTLSLVRTLSEGGFNLERIARSYASWFDSSPFDIGMAIQNALGCCRDRQWASVCERDGYAAAMTQAAALHNRVSKANGSLMRATPLGVWGAAIDDQHVAECAIADSRLSHPNPSCTDAVACYAIAIADADPHPRRPRSGLHCGRKLGDRGWQRGSDLVARRRPPGRAHSLLSSHRFHPHRLHARIPSSPGR